MNRSRLRAVWLVLSAWLVAASAPRSDAQTPLSPDGGVVEQLIIGPIQLEDNNNGVCNDQGRMADTDYFTDGERGEHNALFAEGEEIEPDFGGAAGGLGVAIALTPGINPEADAGVLTVWRADADATGLIDYNVVSGDINDVIMYNLVYLENLEDDCRDVILEVGSDDSAKVIVNGQMVRMEAVCRGIPAIGSGSMVPVSLLPGTNVVLIAVADNDGGHSVRLVVRDSEGFPLTDGSVESSIEPPDSVPGQGTPTVVRAIENDGQHTRGGTFAVELTASDVTSPITVTETLPAGYAVVDAGGGTVDEDANTLTLEVTGDGSVSYSVQAPADERCACSQTLAGSVRGNQGCGAVTGVSTIVCALRGTSDCEAGADADAAELVHAFYFAAGPLFDCFSPNDDSVELTGVIQTDPQGIAYDPDLGYGFDPYRAVDPEFVSSYFDFGPLDDSPNGRTDFPGITCGERLYNSFIGGKTFATNCDAFAVGDPNEPCEEGGLIPDGIIFRVDVEPGFYRFVGAFGDSDNVHAHRVVAEDGGEGEPEEIGDHVVLVHNFDQAQQAIGEPEQTVEPGEGVYARIGFDGLLPPQGDGEFPDPRFVNMDEEGFPTVECPSSPTLEVTTEHLRIHGLQGNSNDGCGGPRDPNGADFVYLEIWRVPDPSGPGTGNFKRGDVDGNGAIEVTDPINNLAFQFLGTFQPPCLDALDFDDSGTIELTDPISNLSAQFLGGPGAAAPGSSACGPDPTDDMLGCDAYPQASCE